MLYNFPVAVIMDVNQFFGTIQQLQSTVASLQNINGNRQNQQQSMTPNNGSKLFIGIFNNVVLL